MDTLNTPSSRRKTSRGKIELHWQLTRIFVCAILLFAAIMKADQLATTPTLGEGLLHARWFNILVVECELFLVAWLMSGLLQKWSWLVAVGCFSAFTAISLYKAVSGEISCGCFGTVNVNPWWTAMIDLFVVGLLIYTRPATAPTLWGDVFASCLRMRNYRKYVQGVIIFWLLIALPMTYAMIFVEKNTLTNLGTEFIGIDGKKTILLEPDRWIGKEFPLVSRFTQTDEHKILKRGVWNILLIHTDCPECLGLISQLEEQNADNVALVVIPSRSKAEELRVPFPLFKLDDRDDWFVKTPTVIKLVDGLCIAQSEESLGDIR